jgi:hypothetical protein
MEQIIQELSDNRGIKAKRHMSLTAKQEATADASWQKAAA